MLEARCRAQANWPGQRPAYARKTGRKERLANRLQSLSDRAWRVIVIDRAGVWCAKTNQVARNLPASL
jgi:hypothetical protein